MVKEGDNRLGPNLYKIVGRKAGSLPDYAFSSAMKEAGFVWDEEKLDRFIANPDEVVPGNNMKPYGGLSSSDDQKKDHRLPCSTAISRGLSQCAPAVVFASCEVGEFRPTQQP